MNKLLSLLLITPLFIITTNLFAEEKQEPNAEEKKSPWKGDVQFGYIMSSGNSESAKLNGKFNLFYNHNSWLHKLVVSAYNSSDTGVTTGERYKLDYQLDKKHNDNNYMFVNGSYEEDRFSGFENLSTFAAGYGHMFYKEGKNLLDSEIGLGVRQSTLTPESIMNGDKSNIKEALIRLAINYHWHISDHSSFNSKLKVDSGQESVISYLDMSFITMINGNLSFKTGIESRHNSKVSEGTKALDTVSTINLLYAF